MLKNEKRSKDAEMRLNELMEKWSKEDKHELVDFAQELKLKEIYYDENKKKWYINHNIPCNYAKNSGILTAVDDIEKWCLDSINQIVKSCWMDFFLDENLDIYNFEKFKSSVEAISNEVGYTIARTIDGIYHGDCYDITINECRNGHICLWYADDNTETCYDIYEARFLAPDEIEEQLH